MASKTRLSSVLSEKSLENREGVSAGRDVATVELDTNFAKVLGLQDAQKVSYYDLYEEYMLNSN